MEIERWVYEFLRRPELTVVGEVLNDLDEPKTVDWIQQVHSIEGEVAVSRGKDCAERSLYMVAARLRS